jgi:hypothetical protein
VLATGTTFEWLDSEWTVRFLGSRFVQLSGGPFGSDGHELVLDTTQVETVQVKFATTEWWTDGAGSATAVQTVYDGTLTIRNLGLRSFEIDPEAIALLKEDPDQLGRFVESERTRLELPMGYPPQSG